MPRGFLSVNKSISLNQVNDRSCLWTLRFGAGSWNSNQPDFNLVPIEVYGTNLTLDTSHIKDFCVRIPWLLVLSNPVPIGWTSGMDYILDHCE